MTYDQFEKIRQSYSFLYDVCFILLSYKTTKCYLKHMPIVMMCENNIYLLKKWVKMKVFLRQIMQDLVCTEAKLKNIKEIVLVNFRKKDIHKTIIC